MVGYFRGELCLDLVAAASELHRSAGSADGRTDGSTCDCGMLSEILPLQSHPSVAGNSYRRDAKSGPSEALRQNCPRDHMMCRGRPLSPRKESGPLLRGQVSATACR